MRSGAHRHVPAECRGIIISEAQRAEPRAPIGPQGEDVLLRGVL